MAYLEWKENLSVGIVELDDHHKQLVALINRVYDSLAAADQVAQVAQVLTELVSYTRYHFDREEQYMRINGYPDYEDHRKAHALLVSQVQDLQRRFNTDPESVKSMETMDFLSRWLMQHIVGKDLKYKPFITTKP